MSNDDFELNIQDSNGPAYQKNEERSGIPLDYVAEKSRRSIEQIHVLYNWIRKNIDVFNRVNCPDNHIEQTHQKQGMSNSSKQENLVLPCWASFRYAITSYLALHNLLNMANETDLFDRLLSMPFEDFETWLDRIDMEGLLTSK
jgi:hypothetical protein